MNVKIVKPPLNLTVVILCIRTKNFLADFRCVCVCVCVQNQAFEPFDTFLFSFFHTYFSPFLECVHFSFTRFLRKLQPPF